MRRKQKKDYRFTIARSEPIDPAHRELARALLNEATDNNGLLVLRELRKLSKNRRRSSHDTGPHLDIRSGEEGRKDKIIVVDGAYTESTTLNAIEGQSPESNLDAVVYFDGYVRRGLLKTQISTANSDVLVTRTLDEFIAAHEPDKYASRQIRGLAAKDFILSQGDPAKWHANQTNAANQLKEYFDGKTLGDIGKDSGKAYKEYRQKKQKLVGGLNSAGEIVPPADQTIRLHLYLLQRAINWFLDEGKIALRVHFDMPEFAEPNPYCLEWEEFVRLILICRGLVPQDGGFKMKKVMKNGVARQVWDRQYLADRETMLAVERYIKIYFMTGTRARSIPPLTWSPSDWHGYVDAQCVFIHRSGRKSAQHKEKPRKTSELLPVTKRMFQGWKKIDENRTAKGNSAGSASSSVPQDWIIHDRNGKPVPGLMRLVQAVFDRAGIDATEHCLKHAGVTTYYKRGLGITQIANFFGTTEQTLRETYLTINWSTDQISQESTKEIKSLKNLGGKVAKYARPNPASVAHQ
jgi:hypothetical protein